LAALRGVTALLAACGEQVAMLPLLVLMLLLKGDSNHRSICEEGDALGEPKLLVGVDGAL
jgi:hypothetical protein